MRQNIKEAIGTVVRDLIKNRLNASFTEKELKKFGILNPEEGIVSNKMKEKRTGQHLQNY